MVSRPEMKALLVAAVALLFSLFSVGCSSSAASKISNQLELGVKYLSENKFEEAVLAYREVIKIDPKNVLAYKGLSIAYSMQGQLDQAEQALQEGLREVADSKALKLALAGVMIDVNKKDAAEEIYYQVIAQDGRYFPAYQAYSKLLLSLNRHSDAVALLEKAASANPDQYKIYTLLSEVYYKNGENGKALTTIGRSLAIEPNQSGSYKLLEEVYSNRWDELIALGDYYIQQGLDIPGQVIKLDGLYQLGQYDQLLQQYGQLPGHGKSSTKARIVAARAHLKLGQKDQALNILRDIQIDNIKDADLLAEIAGVYLEAGDREMARKLAVQGIGLDETSIESYTVLYKSYLDEDSAQSNIWLAKYLVNCSINYNEAKKEKENIIQPKPKDPVVSSTPKPTQENDQASSSSLNAEQLVSREEDIRQTKGENYLTYTNKKYGYTLLIPISWKGHYSIDENNVDESEGNDSFTSFSFKSVMYGEPEIFKIVALDKDKPGQFASDFSVKLLGTQNGMSYYYVHDPYFLVRGSDGDMYKKMINNHVEESFQFVDK